MFLVSKCPEPTNIDEVIIKLSTVVQNPGMPLYFLYSEVYTQPNNIISMT